MGAFSQHLHEPLWLTRPKAAMSSRPWGDQPRSTQDRCARCLHCTGPTRTEGKYSASYVSLYLRALGTKAGTPGGTFPTSFGFITYPAGKEPMMSVYQGKVKHGSWMVQPSVHHVQKGMVASCFQLCCLFTHKQKVIGRKIHRKLKNEKRSLSEVLKLDGQDFRVSIWVTQVLWGNRDAVQGIAVRQCAARLFHQERVKDKCSNRCYEVIAFHAEVADRCEWKRKIPWWIMQYRINLPAYL